MCLEDTPFYHITSRCVRRAFLCGFDSHSGRSYEHRREWVETRLRVLVSLFSIEVGAYAVMSNHYHLIVRVEPSEGENWSDDEVLERWTSLFKGPLLVQRYRNGEVLPEVEMDTLRAIVSVHRARLTSLSWFMKCLNEPIARRANAEDRCTGHFWEARFHSQALLSDKALMTAMVYVDLNPIRARMATCPEQSEFTSVKARIDGERHSSELRKAVGKLTVSGDLNHFTMAIRPLMAFSTPQGDTCHRIALPMTEADYLELVDHTGRAAAQGKRGRIDPGLEPVLQRLGFAADTWGIESATIWSQSRRRLRIA